MNEAEYDIQAHDARPGPLGVMGAWGGLAPRIGVVEGGPLPYRPEALAKKKENEANALALDPEVKCFLPGVPRATYMGFPFQITQSAKYVAFNLMGCRCGSRERRTRAVNLSEWHAVQGRAPLAP